VKLTVTVITLNEAANIEVWLASGAAESGTGSGFRTGSGFPGSFRVL